MQLIHFQLKHIMGRKLLGIIANCFINSLSFHTIKSCNISIGNNFHPTDCGDFVFNLTDPYWKQTRFLCN